MGVLFKAGFGFAVAFYLLHPVEGAAWLNSAVVAPIHAQCAEGLQICGPSPILKSLPGAADFGFGKR